MTATITVAGGNATISFSYTGLTANVQDVLNEAAEKVWNDNGPHFQTTETIDPVSGATIVTRTEILFDSLTNQQKLDLLDAVLRGFIVNAAKQNHVRTADAAAQAEADNTLTI
jgi:hypothetical protein